MRVLVSDARLADALVRCECDVVVAPTIDEVIEVLRGPGAPGVLVLDWLAVSPRGDLGDALAMTGAGVAPYVILLVPRSLTAEAGVAASVLADDMLSTPFVPVELEMRVRVARRIIDLQDRLRVAKEALQRDATHDSLTGVLNRRSLDLLLARELSRAQRLGGCLGLIFVDLDHFKRINDDLGHAAGDAVLVAACARMNSFVRPYDWVGRYGGEEFVIAVPGCDAARTAAVAERLRLLISTRPIIIDEKPVQVTASFGVAATDLLPSATVASLMAAADAAVYVAKRTGRNRVVVGEPGKSVPVKEPSIDARRTSWMSSP